MSNEKTVKLDWTKTYDNAEEYTVYRGPALFGAPEPNERELDDQTCHRCGSAAGWEDCQNCTGGYVHDGDGDDGPYESCCENCRGDGGWYECLAPAEWCVKNPLPGNQTKARGA